jgi:hypothetical protein
MHVKSISGTVTTTVELGTGHYGEKLTITDTGVIAPTMPGAIALYGSASILDAKVQNSGGIFGAAGKSGKSAGAGGIGVEFGASAKMSNAGTVSGGAGGNAGLRGGTAGAGNIGIEFVSAGSLDNSGLIKGGAGGSYTYGVKGTDGGGGDGVLFGGLGTVAIPVLSLVAIPAFMAATFPRA